MKKITFSLILILISILTLTAQPSLAKVSANLQITSHQANASIHPGQNVNVTTTMNPQAVGIATQLTVAIKKQDGQMIAQNTINNPQANSQVTVQLPANAPIGDAYIHAVLQPSVNFTGHIDNVPVRIEKVSANLQITSHQANAAI